MGTIKLFADREFYQRLIALALPVTLQNLINSLVTILDTIMIGQLGTAEIAAAALGGQVFFLFNTLVFGIGSGGGIFAAQFWGKGDTAGIRRALGFSLILVLPVGIVFTLGAVLFPAELIGIFSRDTEVIALGAVYLRGLWPVFIPFAIAGAFVIVLRSIEKIKLAMASSLAAVFLNLILNYLFIFGCGPIPAMGIAGAALATVVAFIVEMLILLIGTYTRRYAAAGTIREFLSFSPALARVFFAAILPIIGNQLVWALGVNTQNLVFARSHTSAAAAFSIITTISGFVWAFLNGLASGAGVLVGMKIGEKDEAKARDYASRILVLSPLTALGAALLLLPLPLVLPRLFLVDPRTLSLINSMLFILAISFPARAFNSALVMGVCRAGGDTLFCAVFDLVFMWFFSLPAAALAALVFHSPVWLVYLLISAEDFLKMFILGIPRFRSGKWLKNVVEGL